MYNSKTRDQGPGIGSKYFFLDINYFKKSSYFKLGKNVAPTVF